MVYIASLFLRILNNVLDHDDETHDMVTVYQSIFDTYNP